MGTRIAATAALALTLLAACARADEVTPAADGGSAPPGDTPVASDMVKPVGGDLRIGEAWYLLGTSLSSVQMPEGLTMTFEETSVGGKAPVNSWSADYASTPTGGLELGPIASTRMAGPDDAMRAEEALFALLQDVDGYTAVEAGELYLFDDQANVLTFSRTQQPAEPTISDATLELADDVVGMTEAAARTTVEGAGHIWRVAARDGQQFALTEDHVATRINATIVDDTVTETRVG